jgi:CheY-like chemotaxis protein
MAATQLLADDSITIQRVIELTFADEDIRVLVAGDGQQAIQKIDSDRPDIVLADIGMPRVDGYAVAAHVKQSPSLKHIPVLLLTGAFEPVDEARARQTGCDGVLVKPFEPQKLVARVRELLNGARSAGLWPVDMPRTQVEQVPPVQQVRQVQVPLVQAAPVQAEPAPAPVVPMVVPVVVPNIEERPRPQLVARPMPELLKQDQQEVAAPPLSMPIRDEPVDSMKVEPVKLDERVESIDLDGPVDLDPAIEPARDSVFDLDAVTAPAEPPAALEGEDVANRHSDYAFRQSRPDLPPPADRLETELDMLDAALSRLDPTANPQELDEETASDFARDLSELRSEARLEEPQPVRPSRPSFGEWDLPQPPSGQARRDQPIDVVPEEVSVLPAAPPAPVAPPAPPVYVPPAPVAATPAASTQHVPRPAPPAPSAPVAPVTPPAPVAAAPQYAPPAPPAVVHVPVISAPTHQAPAVAEAPAGKPAAPATPAAHAPLERPTLAAAFSALLAAEKSRPAAQAAAPQISEAAIEEVVRRVLARMAGETVNRVVLETAERMIRDEISRTKDPLGR